MKKLFIGNLAPNTKEQELQDLFSEFGKVRSLKLVTDVFSGQCKGFGFIEQDAGDDLFVHQSEIRQSGFRYLILGDRVEYEVGSGKKGPVALKVIRTRPAADPEKYETYIEEPAEDRIRQVS